MVSQDHERSLRLGQLLRQFQAVEAQLRALKLKIQRLDVRLVRSIHRDRQLQERLRSATENEDVCYE